MRTQGMRWAAGVLILAVAACAAAIEVPLKYVEIANAGRGFMPRGMTSVSGLSEKAPEGAKLPKFIGDTQAFGMLPIAGGKYLAALDKAATDDKFYRRLFIDLDQDGSLADEEPFVSESATDNYASFQGIRIEREVDGKKIPYQISTSFRMVTTTYMTQGMNDTQQLSEYISLGCAYTGEFDADGKHYFVALGDMNCNGRIDDCHSQSKDGRISATSGGKQVIFREGDAFLISENPTFDASELMVLGTHLVLGAKTYTVKIDMAGEKMTLTPVSGEMTGVKVPAGTALLELVSADHARSIMLVDPSPRARIPAGQYSIFKYMMKKKDKQGDTWCAVAQQAGAPREIAVGGESVALNFGEPFGMEVKSTPRTNSAVSNTYLTLSILDPMGMDLRGIFHVAGNNTQIALAADKEHPGNPKYVIKKGAETVAQGQFEYG